MDYTTAVESILELHGVPKMDKEYELYYDETNNARVFRLREDRFNFDEHAYFVLGGIAFEKGKSLNQESINKLLKEIQSQENSAEVKFKHIRQGANTFLELLNKQRVKGFIDWLVENKCWIHYSYQDNFYFSIVDIVDSLEESAFGGLQFSRDLKNSLYKYIIADKEWFISLLSYYDYPNIKNHNEFIQEILNWIDGINPEGEDFNIEYLRQALKCHRKNGLLLLEDNLDNVLIENFRGVYLNSILTYYKSKHIFDEEPEIQKLMEQETIEIFGEKISSEFVKSDTSIFVQISDLIVGILRMWLGFLESHSINELERIFSELSVNQNKMIKKFQKVLYNSLLETWGFKHGVGSEDFEEKINFFMEYKF